MLSEIFLLRLETLLRASQEAVPAKKARFVPLSAVPFLASEKRPCRENIWDEAPAWQGRVVPEPAASRVRASHRDADGAFGAGSARERASHG
jgi:hypothetical protein